MADTRNAYSLKFLEIFQIEHKIYPYINSGVFYFPNKLFDLVFIENLLNDKVINLGLTRKIPWLEQTIWALLAAKIKDVYYFDYDQFVMAEEVINRPIKDDLVAVHCVFGLRDPAFESVKMLTSDSSNVYHDVKLIYIDSYLNKVAYVKEQIRVRWTRITSRSHIEKSRNKTFRPKIKRYQ